MTKTDFDSAYDRGMEVINRNIKTLGDRATLLLGYLIIVLLALTSFVFSDSSNSLKPYAFGLLINYSAMAFALLIGVIMPSFEEIFYSNSKKGRQVEINNNMERYKNLRWRFNSIILYIFISSAAVSAWLSTFLLA